MAIQLGHVSEKNDSQINDDFIIFLPPPGESARILSTRPFTVVLLFARLGPPTPWPERWRRRSSALHLRCLQLSVPPHRFLPQVVWPHLRVGINYLPAVGNRAQLGTASGRTGHGGRIRRNAVVMTVA